MCLHFEIGALLEDAAACLRTTEWAAPATTALRARATAPQVLSSLSPPGLRGAALGRVFNRAFARGVRKNRAGDWQPALVPPTIARRRSSQKPRGYASITAAAPASAALAPASVALAPAPAPAPAVACGPERFEACATPVPSPTQVPGKGAAAAQGRPSCHLSSSARSTPREGPQSQSRPAFASTCLDSPQEEAVAGWPTCTAPISATSYARAPGRGRAGGGRWSHQTAVLPGPMAPDSSRCRN